MATESQIRLLTAEEFWLLPNSLEGGKMELIDGVSVTHRPAGGTHGSVLGDVGVTILEFVERRRLGSVGFSCGFVLARNPDVVRSPDAHFVRASRLPGGRMEEGFFFGAPDLAIDVVDYHDLDSLVARKIDDYQRAGVPRVWVVRPDFRSITVHFLDGTSHKFEDGASLTHHEAGFEVDGFALDITELFGEH